MSADILESRFEYGKYDWLQRNRDCFGQTKFSKFKPLVSILVIRWEKTAALGYFQHPFYRILKRPDWKTRSTR